MKNKKIFFTFSFCSIVIFVVSFFLLNSAYAGKDCGKPHTSKVRTVVSPAYESEQHVDEHAGHNHPAKKEYTEPVDEHAGHNHPAKKEYKEPVDEHAGHNHVPKK